VFFNQFTVTKYSTKRRITTVFMLTHTPLTYTFTPYYNQYTNH